jgi:hypothetical protein
MALKESNKNRSNMNNCCGQGCNNHANKGCGSNDVDDTSSYITGIIIGSMFVFGIFFLLVNSFIFPTL